MRTLPFRITLALTALVLFGTACDGAGDPELLELDPASIFLGEGETATLSGGDVTLTFTALIGDNRCPQDAVCITGGAAVLTARLVRTSDGAQLSDTLAIGDVSFASHPPITGFGYTVELHEVLPVPTLDQPAPDDVRAVFFPTPVDR